MQNTDAYRAKLIELREELTRRLKAVEKDLHHAENKVEKDFAEQATQRENDDVLTSLEVDTKARLREIDRALVRIEKGEYGICLNCGEEIDEKRLQAVPYASHCIRCAE